MTSSSSRDLSSGESVLTRDLSSSESNRLYLLTIRLDTGALDMDGGAKVINDPIVFPPFLRILFLTVKYNGTIGW